MSEDIKCHICKKKIKEGDNILLGSKSDYLTLPSDISSADVVFLHGECLVELQKSYEDSLENETQNTD